MPYEDRWHSVNEVAGSSRGSSGHRVPVDRKQVLAAHRIGRLWKCKLSEVDGWARTGGIVSGRPLYRDLP